MEHLEKLKDFTIHGTYQLPMQIYYQNYPSGGLTVPYHWHKEIELIYVESGSMEMTVNMNTFTAFAGDFFCINSGELHQIYSEGTQSSLHHACVFSPDILNFEYWDEAQNQYIHPLLTGQLLLPGHIQPNSSCYHDVISVFKKMLKLNNERSDGWYMEFKGCLYQLLGIMIRYHLLIQNTDEHPEENRKIEQCKKILGFIHSHYTEKIYLNDLAQVININPQYFCRFFKNIFHMTPVEYINHYRISQSIKMLQSGSRSILEICLDCGFESPSYFVKLFKKETGFTPAEYRKRFH